MYVLVFLFVCLFGFAFCLLFELTFFKIQVPFSLKLRYDVITLMQNKLSKVVFCMMSVFKSLTECRVQEQHKTTHRVNNKKSRACFKTNDKLNTGIDVV